MSAKIPLTDCALNWQSLILITVTLQIKLYQNFRLKAKVMQLDCSLVKVSFLFPLVDTSQDEIRFCY